MKGEQLATRNGTKLYKVKMQRLFEEGENDFKIYLVSRTRELALISRKKLQVIVFGKIRKTCKEHFSNITLNIIVINQKYNYNQKNTYKYLKHFLLIFSNVYTVS